MVLAAKPAVGRVSVSLEKKGRKQGEKGHTKKLTRAGQRGGSMVRGGSKVALLR